MKRAKLYFELLQPGLTGEPFIEFDSHQRVPGVCQNIALGASPTASNSVFLIPAFSVSFNFVFFPNYLHT